MNIINVNGLTKGFKLYKKPVDRLKEVLFRKSYHHRYQALDNVSFSLAAGEVLGVLGRNGAGKSTLLKLLSGVLMPESGSIDINGHITGLLELGTGFDIEISGYENIYSNGLLIGMDRKSIDENFDSIVEFSELGHFIDEPLRTYSSGMVMRLAFSIAIHANPQCFLVDEALSVGDGHFQQKCMRRIKLFREEGGAIIFVSHDLNAVKMLCDRVIVLDKGVVAYRGSADEGVNAYNRIMAAMDEHEADSVKTIHSYGDLSAEILSGRLVGQQSLSDIISSGELASIEIDIKGHTLVEDVSVGIMIRDRFGQDIFGVNSYQLGHSFTLKENETAKVLFEIPMDVATGKYTITVALHRDENHLGGCYHWCDNLIRFEVAGVMGNLFSGVCRLHPKLKIEQG